MPKNLFNVYETERSTGAHGAHCELFQDQILSRSRGFSKYPEIRHYHCTCEDVYQKSFMQSKWY